MSGHCLRQPEKVYGLDFSPEEVQEAAAKGRLLSLDLETSLACNLRCVYCFNNAGKKRTNELEKSELIDVIDQAVDLGVKVVSVIGGGEPLMYRHIMEVLEHLSRKPIRRILFTNGMLINREIAAALHQYGFSVVTKFNSLKPEVQDKLSGVEGSFAKIQKGIAHLLEAGYPSETHPLGVETIICRHNIDDLPQMWEWARERKMTPYFETITFMGRASSQELNVSSDELKAVFEKFRELDEKKYGFTWKSHPPIAGLSCKRNYYNVVITSNGYVKPCVGIDINVGNIRHAPLAEIVRTSPVLKSLRNLRENIKGHCKVCEHAEECYGCRGLAYHICGDYLASDPLCWNNPDRVVK